MLKTMNEDEFVDDVLFRTVEVHHIVYGYTGWSDEFDTNVIDLLLRIGAIEQTAIHTGPGFETRVYVSRVGVITNG